LKTFEITESHAMKIMKFGGSSVGDAGRITGVIEIIARLVGQGVGNPSNFSRIMDLYKHDLKHITDNIFLKIIVTLIPLQP